MLIKMNQIYKNLISEEIKIETRNDKMGIVNTLKDEVIIPFEYDNIFVYGPELFVLYKKGKVGAVNLSKKKGFCPEWIAKCEYDTLDTNCHDIIFSKEEEYLYVSSYGFWRNKEPWYIKLCLKNLIIDGDFVYGCKGDEYVIFDTRTAKIIWRENIDKTKALNCFVYIGKSEKKPLFYCLTTGRFLKWRGRGYVWMERDCLLKPIIINGENVVNVIESTGGIGLLDLKNSMGVAPVYHKAKVELLVTLENSEETRLLRFKVDDGSVSMGKIIGIEDWQ